jgi:hypothetical protein
MENILVNGLIILINELLLKVLVNLSQELAFKLTPDLHHMEAFLEQLLPHRSYQYVVLSTHYHQLLVSFKPVDLYLELLELSLKLSMLILPLSLEPLGVHICLPFLQTVLLLHLPNFLLFLLLFNPSLDLLLLQLLSEYVLDLFHSFLVSFIHHGIPALFLFVSFCWDFL